MMKYFTIIAFALLAVSIANAGTIQHQFGVIGPTDRLLHREAFVRESSFLRKTVHDFTYPPPGVNRGPLITAIVVHDQHPDKGEVSIKAGGVGYQTVTVHLKSARNHGFNFIVEIYGH